MTIDQLGSLGEFIAAIAVIISLIFVAIQLARNTRELRSGAFRDVFQAYSNIRRSIYQDPEFAALIARTRNGHELNTDQEIRVASYLHELSWCFVQLSVFQKTQVMDWKEESWEKMKGLYLIELESEFGRGWWLEHSIIFPDHFVAEMTVNLESRRT